MQLSSFFGERNAIGWRTKAVFVGDSVMKDQSDKAFALKHEQKKVCIEHEAKKRKRRK
jgi:hypothetical protein